MFKLNSLETDTQIGEIYETKNYNKFSYLKTNRPINQMRVNNIKNSIDQIGQVEPIMVDEAFKIIDGQHRFEACMALEKQVKYFISNSLIDKEALMIEANMNKQNWNNDNFCNHWMMKEKETHPELVEMFKVNPWTEDLPYHVFHMCREFKIQHQVLMALIYNYGSLNGASPAKRQKNEELFKRCELKIYNLQRYRENINFFVAIINYEKDSSQKIATQRNFQSAILKFVRSKNFVKSKFLTQIQKYPFTLERKSTIDDYVTLIMYIYNYAQKKNKIQYSDIMGDN